MGIKDKLIARQGMTNQNSIRFVGIEFAAGRIGDRKRANSLAGIEAHRHIAGELDLKAGEPARTGIACRRNIAGSHRLI